MQIKIIVITIIKYIMCAPIIYIIEILDDFLNIFAINITAVSKQWKQN